MFFQRDLSAGRLLLTDCIVADVRNLSVLRGVSILLESGKVAAVGGFDPVGVDAQVVSAVGCTVTPGLIDAHVHLCLSGQPGCHLTLGALSPDEKEGILRENLLMNLNNGVTAVRDLGCPWDTLEMMRQMDGGDAACPSVQAGGDVAYPSVQASGDTAYPSVQAGGDAAYPSVQASGPVLTIPGGHGAFFGEAAYLGRAREIFGRLRKSGAEVVKIIGTGGNLSPNTDCHGTQYTDAEFSGIMDAARAAGFDVACHAHAASAVEQCLRFGVRSVEHGSYIEEGQILRMAEKGDYFWVPTVCPGRLIGGLSEEAIDRVERRRRNLRTAIRCGAMVAAGTDAGIGGLLHGCLPYELDEFMDAGMTPLAALRSATHLAAVMMRQEGRIGVVEAGAEADLLLFEGDIEGAAFSFHRPRAVIKGGRVVWSGWAQPMVRG